MTKKLQPTNLHKTFWMALERLSDWGRNPWRRYSLYLIIFLSGFFLGSSLGMINGTLALMDPVGAFIVVIIIEIMVRLRRQFDSKRKSLIILNMMDMLRMGLIYGLFMEGFKLL
ncbi:DUF565 domain-containing protein [Prochlorococcus sp. MIT 1223]|uniref:DUF565 domain-containing protein n=1 Tax=Prochlorococcus sp. MIT 1223 TaxID=3096217 RepID=UPI002A75F36D|nr:DUF565 domain-containing protein [Prochlorococcus sp. MIT 1223]